MSVDGAAGRRFHGRRPVAGDIDGGLHGGERVAGPVADQGAQRAGIATGRNAGGVDAGVAAQGHGAIQVKALRRQDRPVDAEDVVRATTGVERVEAVRVDRDPRGIDALRDQVVGHHRHLVAGRAAAIAGHENRPGLARLDEPDGEVEPSGEDRLRAGRIGPQLRPEHDHNRRGRHARLVEDVPRRGHPGPGERHAHDDASDQSESEPDPEKAADHPFPLAPT